MRSIQALSWLETEKLYMGAPITTMSAARNSSSTAWLCASVSLTMLKRINAAATPDITIVLTGFFTILSTGPSHG